VLGAGTTTPAENSSNKAMHLCHLIKSTFYCRHRRQHRCSS